MADVEVEDPGLETLMTDGEAHTDEEAHASLPTGSSSSSGASPTPWWFDRAFFGGGEVFPGVVCMDFAN